MKVGAQIPPPTGGDRVGHYSAETMTSPDPSCRRGKEAEMEDIYTVLPLDKWAEELQEMVEYLLPQVPPLYHQGHRVALGTAK